MANPGNRWNINSLMSMIGQHTDKPKSSRPIRCPLTTNRLENVEEVRFLLPWGAFLSLDPASYNVCRTLTRRFSDARKVGVHFYSLVWNSFQVFSDVFSNVFRRLKTNLNFCGPTFCTWILEVPNFGPVTAIDVDLDANILLRPRTHRWTLITVTHHLRV